MSPVIHHNENIVGLYWNVTYKKRQAKTQEKYTYYSRVKSVELHSFTLFEMTDERQEKQQM